MINPLKTYKLIDNRINNWIRNHINERCGTPTKYNGKKIMNMAEGNKYIYDKILSCQPFFVGRFGSTELNAITKYEDKSNHLTKKQCNAIEMMQNYSGFFPCDPKLGYELSNVYKKSISKVDCLGVWFKPLEDYMMKKYGPQSNYMQLNALEPYLCDSPWSKGLMHKRVLVIHPFSETIQQQYRKRKMLFSDENILPDFELITLKAVQTIAGSVDERFKDWFEALEYMHHKTKTIEFDVAIIGCGAYGFPLGAMIKEDGKQAIHMGGATQILFGIKGARWDSMPTINSLYNDYWVRPSESERPTHSDIVENACYW